MRKRKPDTPSPATSQGDNLAAIQPDPPPARHGPAQPARTLYGFASLRFVMKLSADVPIEQVCQEAALELASLRIALSPHWRTVNLDS